MTITSIIRVPEVGQVGTKATFRASGEKVGTELRYYLTFAPVNSVLATLDRDATPASARLQVDNLGAAYFTPDVPGHYGVEVHDVTVTKTFKTYSDAPDVPDTDNDFAGAPVVTLDTAEALSRYGHGDFRAVQTVTRSIGSAPNTLAFALRVHDDVEFRLPDAVTVTASPGPVAQVAQYDDAILGIRDLLAEGRVRNYASAHLDGAHYLMQANLSNGLLFALNRWMLHTSEAAARYVHLVADGVNDVDNTEVTTLAGALIRLAAIRVAYEAHSTSTTYHPSADTRNQFQTSYPDPVDLVTGLDFARTAFQVMVHGPNETTEVTQNDPGVTLFGHMILGNHVASNINDPEGATTFDFSSSLAGLLSATNRLTAVYNAHRVRVSQPAAHLAIDSENDIRALGLIDDVNLGETPTIDIGSAISLVNQLAECIERHTNDLARDGTTANVTHQNTRPVKIGSRAGDLASALTTLELCCEAMERHALDGGEDISAHESKVWGGNGPLWYFYPGVTYASWPLFTRAQIHWKRFQLVANPPTPEHLNSLPTGLAALGWK